MGVLQEKVSRVYSKGMITSATTLTRLFTRSLAHLTGCGALRELFTTGSLKGMFTSAMILIRLLNRSFLIASVL